jgi:hypothetical protein
MPIKTGFISKTIGEIVGVGRNRHAMFMVSVVLAKKRIGRTRKRRRPDVGGAMMTLNRGRSAIIDGWAYSTMTA